MENKEINDKLLEHDLRFDRMDERFDKMEKTTQENFNKIDKRFERMEEANLQLGIRFEDLEKNVKLVLDVVIDTQEKFEKYENLDRQVQDHGHRIAAVEHFVSRHPD